MRRYNLEEFQNIELADGAGVLLCSPLEATTEFTDPNLLRDIDVVWGAALYYLQNKPAKFVFSPYYSLSTVPPKSTNPERIIFSYDSDGSHRDVYRTLTVSPERAESYKFSEVYWNEPGFGNDRDITYSAEDAETIRRLAELAQRIRENPDTKVKLASVGTEQRSTLPSPNVTAAAQGKLWDVFRGIPNIEELTLHRLQILCTDIFLTKVQDWEALTEEELIEKVFKELLVRLHPDKGGDEILFQGVEAARYTQRQSRDKSNIS
ncbi:hypothetical protein KBD20_02240 [Candidatus Saccharibacteria bacterium]|nr:hypothetical protein [Candidatus Saccharibacteria bacterium]